MNHSLLRLYWTKYVKNIPFNNINHSFHIDEIKNSRTIVGFINSSGPII